MHHRVVVTALVLMTACSSADLGENQDPSAKPADPATTVVPVAGTDMAARADVSLSPPAFTHRPAVLAPVMATSFEAASAVCNDWPAEGADAIRSVPPHSGSYACRICATGSAPDIAIAHATGALDPGRYVLTAWLRKRPNNAGPDGASASLEADTASGVVAATSPVMLSNDYAKIVVTLDLAEAATSIRARIGAAASATQCVLIDDVLVERAL